MTTIQIRKDTENNWLLFNPILADGEQGYDTDTGKMKIGNGVSTWNTLSYFAEPALDDDKADLNITINNQTGTAYTLVLNDNGKYIRMNNASANTLTVPNNASVAFPIGTQIYIRQVNAGQTTISSTATINTSETLLLAKQGSTASLVKVDIDEWDLTGDLETA